MRERTIRSVLITGGAGFLGSYLARSYLTSGISVRAVGHLSHEAHVVQEPLPDRIEFQELDLCDSPQLKDTFVGRDLVIHTAAVTRAYGPEARNIMERANIEATRRTIQACRDAGVPTLLHVSTTAAIGISPDAAAPADERFTFNLGHLGLSYNTSKHKAERLVLEANGAALETLVVNPGFVFGWNHGRYRGEDVIARVLRSSVVACTDGGLSVVHVDDVVSGMREVANSGRSGERYILSGENPSFLKIAETVRRVAGVRKTIIMIPNAARDIMGRLSNLLTHARGVPPNLYLDRRYAYQYYSSEKARQQFQYRPRSFESIVTDYLHRARAI